jgi:hypothetical protein
MANQIIHFGISVEGKKVYGCKLLLEPSRCLKCQIFNGRHTAADCPQEHDTCGTCGANHRTASCAVDIQELYHCANCNTDGHASWSCECPIFITRWQANRSRNEEAKYKYFPTEDPNTWDKIEDKSNNYETDPLPPHITTQTHNNEWRTIHHQNQQPRNNTRRHENANHIPLGTQIRLTDRWIPAQDQNQPRPPAPTTRQSEEPASPSSRWTPTPEFHTTPLPGSNEDHSGWD